MDNHDNILTLQNYAGYAAFAGLGLYLLVITLGFFGLIEKEEPWLFWFKLLAAAMMISPFAIQFYFSKEAILWLALLICAFGIWVKVRNKLGI